MMTSVFVSVSVDVDSENLAKQQQLLQVDFCLFHTLDS